MNLLKKNELQFQKADNWLGECRRIDSVETLAHGLAHDFNNILSGIMANLNILSLKPDRFTVSQKANVQDTINLVKRCAAIVERFQNLSIRDVPVKSAVDFCKVAKEVFNILEKITDKKIERIIDINEGRFFVFADSNEIHQIFLNLGINAIHAIEAKGVQKGDYIKLSIKPDPVKGPRTVRFSQEQFYQICFEDTGVGMPEEIRKKAFDPLFSTKSNQGNKIQGLGLAMVHDIVVKRHHGHVDIASEVGKGTVFNIFMPKADKTDCTFKKFYSIQHGTQVPLCIK